MARIDRVYDLVQRRFRRRRMARLRRTFRFGPSTTMLDVGGEPEFWVADAPEAEITLLNVRTPETIPDGLRFVAGDATDLPFADNSFDLVFSNSLIQCVGSPEQQARAARELRRVGRSLWVQTPSRHFPIEPHALTPFIHWLPRGLQRRLLRNFTLFGWIARPSPGQIDYFVDVIRLLDYGEMTLLFPDCEIRRERFMGMTKSLIAVRRAEDPP